MLFAWQFDSLDVQVLTKEIRAISVTSCICKLEIKLST